MATSEISALLNGSITPWTPETRTAYSDDDDASTDVNSIAKSVIPLANSWEKQLQTADERQTQLLHLQWNLVREQMGAHAQEIAAIQLDLQALRVERSQQSKEQEEQNKRVRELQLQMQPLISASTSHRREMELAMSALAEDTKAGMRSLQADAIDRREALDRTARNFAAAEDRIGKAFQFLSELNIALDEEKKARASCFDEVTQEVRTIRVAKEDDLSKRAARDEHVFAEVSSIAAQVEAQEAMEATLRQAIQDVSDRLFKAEEARNTGVASCHEQFLARLSSQEQAIASYQEQFLARVSGQEQAIASCQEQLLARISSQERAIASCQEQFLGKFSIQDQAIASCQDQFLGRFSMQEQDLTRMKDLLGDTCGDNLALRARAEGSIATLNESMDVLTSRIDEIDRRVCNMLEEESTSQQLEAIRQQLRSEFDDTQRLEALERKLLADIHGAVDSLRNQDLHSRHLVLLEERLQIEIAKAIHANGAHSQRIESLEEKVNKISDTRLASLAVECDLKAAIDEYKRSHGSLSKENADRHEHLMQRLLVTEEKLQSELACWQRVQQEHIDALIQEQSSRLEAINEDCAAAAREIPNQLAQRCDRIATEYHTRISALEAQDGAVRRMLRDDRSSMLACCEALEEKLAATMADQQESVFRVQETQREWAATLEALQKQVTEQFSEQSAKASTQDVTFYEKMTIAYAQELASVQQLIAKESEKRVESQKALQDQLGQEALAREEQHERIQTHFSQERNTRATEVASLLNHLTQEKAARDAESAALLNRIAMCEKSTSKVAPSRIETPGRESALSGLSGETYELSREGSTQNLIRQGSLQKLIELGGSHIVQNGATTPKRLQSGTTTPTRLRSASPTPSLSGPRASAFVCKQSLPQAVPVEVPTSILTTPTPVSVATRPPAPQGVSRGVPLAQDRWRMTSPLIVTRSPS